MLLILLLLLLMTENDLRHGEIKSAVTENRRIAGLTPSWFALYSSPITLVAVAPGDDLVDLTSSNLDVMHSSGLAPKRGFD
jgi:hypothetical protein